MKKDLAQKEMSVRHSVVEALTALTDESEVGEPWDSDTDEEVEDDLISQDPGDRLFTQMPLCREIWLNHDIDMPRESTICFDDNDEMESEEGAMRWQFNERIDPPINASKGEKTLNE